MFNFRGRLFWHIFHSVDSLLEKLKVTNIFRYLKVSDIESDFIYGGDLLSFISSLKVYKLSALDKEDKVFRMALYRKICPSVSLNIIKTICTKLIKKFGFINFWRVFWVKTSKRKIKFTRNFRILGNWSKQYWPFFIRSSSMKGKFLFFHTDLIEKNHHQCFHGIRNIQKGSNMGMLLRCGTVTSLNPYLITNL